MSHEVKKADKETFTMSSGHSCHGYMCTHPPYDTSLDCRTCKQSPYTHHRVDLHPYASSRNRAHAHPDRYRRASACQIGSNIGCAGHVAGVAVVEAAGELAAAAVVAGMSEQKVAMSKWDRQHWRRERRVRL